MKPSTGAPARILIVDDHGIVREGLVGILSGTPDGWALTQASSGFQAIEMLRREPSTWPSSTCRCRA